MSNMLRRRIVDVPDYPILATPRSSKWIPYTFTAYNADGTKNWRKMFILSKEDGLLDYLINKFLESFKDQAEAIREGMFCVSDELKALGVKDTPVITKFVIHSINGRKLKTKVTILDNGTVTM